jgi:hypothetical protein
MIDILPEYQSQKSQGISGICGLCGFWEVVIILINRRLTVYCSWYYGLNESPELSEKLLASFQDVSHLTNGEGSYDSSTLKIAS